MMHLYLARPTSVPVIRCSPPSWAVQIAALEEDVAHVISWLRFDAAEHRTPERLALNPAGSVPFAVDGDAILSDTLVIIEHIVSRSSHQHLLPRPDDILSREQALSIKEAGMQVFRARMAGSSSDDSWSPLRRVFTEWERRFERDRGRADAARLTTFSLLGYVYFETAGSLGLANHSWPALEGFARQTRLRPGVRAAWPEGWPAIAP